MVKYPEDGNLAVPSITGGLSGQAAFIPWQPGTWPRAPQQFNPDFHATLSQIFYGSMVDELRNVIRDIQAANPGGAPLAHRGHVVAVACMCALDAVSLYGYKNKNVKKFIREHFPDAYKPYASRIYPDYRHNLVHAWNLFGNAALLPGNEPISEHAGQVAFGLLNFVDALEQSVNDFLVQLQSDGVLQQRALHRYRELTGEIKPSRRNGSAFYIAVGFGLGIGVAALVAALPAR